MVEDFVSAASAYYIQTLNLLSSLNEKDSCIIEEQKLISFALQHVTMGLHAIQLQVARAVTSLIPTTRTI